MSTLKIMLGWVLILSCVVVTAFMGWVCFMGVVLVVRSAVQDPINHRGLLDGLGTTVLSGAVLYLPVKFLLEILGGTYREIKKGKNRR